MLSILPSESVEAAVGSSSVVIALAMTTTSPIGVSRYLFTATVASWISQGSSAGSGSALIPAGKGVIVDGHFGSHIAVLEQSTAGVCSLTPVIQ